MADAFRFAAKAVYEANETLCQLDPVGGRARQYTVLDLPALFINKAFRKDVLALVDDREVKDWWNHHWEVSLDPRLRMETSNPVVTKINKFKASWAARMVIGQPASTIDPRAWLRERAIVVVDLASGLIGEDTAALLGGTILNYLKETIAAQQGTPRGLRDRVTLLVDEFHMIPGADYEGLLSGQAKSGANLHLATQSLARLDMETRDGTRALRKIVFDNIRGCFAFHTSAENAAYLVPELGGESEVDVEDLVGLSDYHCYARLSRGERRLPAFLVTLDPPPVVDPHRAARLAAASAECWGRARADVLADRQFALDRIEAASAAERLERRRREEEERGKKGGGGTRNRNQNRLRDGAQKSLFDLAPGAGAGWPAQDRRGDNGEEANE